MTLPLSERKIDVTKLDVYTEELQYHDRSGNPIVSLLPTTPYDATKANIPVITTYAKYGEDGHNVDGDTIEDEHRCDWALAADSSTYMVVCGSG